MHYDRTKGKSEVFLTVKAKIKYELQSCRI